MTTSTAAPLEPGPPPAHPPAPSLELYMPETTDPQPEAAEPDNPAAYALARHIADHPVSTIQAAFRYLNAPLTIELQEPAAVPSAPADRAARRERYAAAIRAAGDTAYGNSPFYEAITTAVIAVADAEQAELRSERDLAIAHDRQPYPTAWAYEQACKALHRKTEAIERVRSVLESEAVVGRSALEYRGLITAALMADDASGPSRLADEAQQPPCAECDHPYGEHQEGDDPVTPGTCSACTDDDRHDYEAQQPETQAEDELLVHVGWWCWRGDNHGHLATMACRSDNVPIHVPAEWADEMRAVLQRLEDGDDEEQPETQRCDVEFVGGGQCTKRAGHWTPKTQDPHTPGPVDEKPEPIVVAYRNPDRPSVLLCREHGDGWWGLTALTADDLPDGGICTYGDPADPGDACGRDVLIPPAAVSQPGKEA